MKKLHSAWDQGCYRDGNGRYSWYLRPKPIEGVRWTSNIEATLIHGSMKAATEECERIAEQLGLMIEDGK